MQLPEELINSLTHTTGFDERSFRAIHQSGEQVTSVRVNPRKPASLFANADIETQAVPWSSYGLYLSKRPSFTFDPLFHAGCYYVQEASSMFIEQAFAQHVDKNSALKILDMSAAPGGKSTHLLSLMNEKSFLVCNEIIRSRANILKDNIIKWGYPNVLVTNNSPADFKGLDGYFDVILLDAPCSGSGLFRRDEEAISEWSLPAVDMCATRQQDIISYAWPLLKENGILIYSTCSYSEKENERVVKWLCEKEGAEVLNIKLNDEWGIIKSEGGYRFWPDKVKGEGFFLSCIKKKDEEGESRRSKIRASSNTISKNELDVIGRFVKTTALAFRVYENSIYAWPTDLQEDFERIVKELRVIYSGINTGEIIHGKFIPNHALAMSRLTSDTVNTCETDYETAIKYLQRKEINPVLKDKGWQMITYRKQPLGWINAVASRINNYYPKELRIMKDRP